MTPEELEELMATFGRAAEAGTRGVDPGPFSMGRTSGGISPNPYASEPEADMYLTQEEVDEAGPDDERQEEVRGIQASVAEARRPVQLDPMRIERGGSRPQTQARIPEIKPRPNRALEEASRYASAARSDRASQGIMQAIQGFATAATGNMNAGRSIQTPEPTGVRDFMATREMGREREGEARQNRQDTEARVRQERLDSSRAETEGLQQQRLRQQVGEGEDSAAMRESMRDPQSQQSQNDRALALETIGLIESGEGIPDGFPTMDMAAARQAAQNASSFELRNNPLMSQLLDYGLALRRSQGSQRRAARGTGTGGGAGLRSVTRSLEAYNDLREGGMSEERAEQAVRRAYPDFQRPENQSLPLLRQTGVDDRAGNNRVSRLSRDLTQERDMRSALEIADGALSAATPEQIQVAILTQDLPPGLTPQQAERLRNAVRELEATVRHARYGAAQTEQEVANFRREMGVAMTSDPSILPSVVRRMRANADLRERDIRSGYTPDENNQQRDQFTRPFGNEGPSLPTSSAPERDVEELRARARAVLQREGR